VSAGHASAERVTKKTTGAALPTSEQVLRARDRRRWNLERRAGE
jgi:hypothetical protein